MWILDSQSRAVVGCCLLTHIHLSPLCYIVFLFVRYSGFPHWDASHNGKLYITTFLKLEWPLMCFSQWNEDRIDVCHFQIDVFQLAWGLPPQFFATDWTHFRWWCSIGLSSGGKMTWSRAEAGPEWICDHCWKPLGFGVICCCSKLSLLWVIHPSSLISKSLYLQLYQYALCSGRLIISDCIQQAFFPSSFWLGSTDEMYQ